MTFQGYRVCSGLRRCSSTEWMPRRDAVRSGVRRQSLDDILVARWRDHHGQAAGVLTACEFMYGGRQSAGMSSALVHTHRRPSRRLQSGRGTFGAAPALPNPAPGQGLRLERNPQASRGARRDPQHSAQSQSQVEELLLAVPLSSAQRHRAHVLPLERLQAGGNAL